MQLTLLILAGLSVLELLIWLRPVWLLHKPLAALLAGALAADTVALTFSGLRLWVVAILLLSSYRIFNLLRIAKERMHVDFLYHASRRTSFWLIGLQIMVAGLAFVGGSYGIGVLAFLYLLAVIQLLSAAVLLGSTLRHLKTTRPPALTEHYTDRELPSLTVAIPARNETEDLEACLQSLIASTYPKLEIIVLDDCSQSKRTPEIIRGFAHDGVRFVPGKVPPGHWLAKNYAYSQLAAEANGELLLFCGVDARFEADSITALVKSLLQKNKSMLSILPRNRLPKGAGVFSLLVQPNRYAWELALPRRLLTRPPVLSTCWLITRQALKNAGGFEAVSRKIIPESYFARHTSKHDDGYSFLCSDHKIGVTSSKTFDEQLATATRTRYPQLHRRPEIVALVSAAEFGVLVWPLVIALAALAGRLWPLALISGTAYCLQALIYARIINLTYRKTVLSGAWLLPFAVIQDILLLHYSMWLYEFRDVIWKDRNVCMPVMRIEPAESFSLRAANSAQKR